MTKCYAWSRSRERLDEVLQVLPQLGGDELRAWAADYAERQVDRIAWDVDYLAEHYQFGSCLNVGGSPYIFEYFLRKRRPDVRVETIDLDKERFPNVEQVLGVRVHSVDIEKNAKALSGLGQFDCVVLCDVIEHLRLDLIETLVALRGTLAPGGLFYLSTPNGVGIAGMKRFVLGQRTGPDPIAEWSKLKRIGHMGHVREYSLVEICSLLENTGFAVEDKFFRAGMRRPESLRARSRNTLQNVMTRIAPSLGNELVVIARRVE